MHCRKNLHNNAFGSVCEVIIEVEILVFVVSISKRLDTVNDVGWGWEGCLFPALIVLDRLYVE